MAFVIRQNEAHRMLIEEKFGMEKHSHIWFHTVSEYIRTP